MKVFDMEESQSPLFARPTQEQLQAAAELRVDGLLFVEPGETAKISVSQGYKYLFVLSGSFFIGKIAIPYGSIVSISSEDGEVEISTRGYSNCFLFAMFYDSDTPDFRIQSLGSVLRRAFPGSLSCQIMPAGPHSRRSISRPRGLNYAIEGLGLEETVAAFGYSHMTWAYSGCYEILTEDEQGFCQWMLFADLQTTRREHGIPLGGLKQGRSFYGK